MTLNMSHQEMPPMTNSNPSTTLDFATISGPEALDALVELEVAKWGESERAASRQLHAGKSRGLLINSIVHHQINGFGDAFDPAAKKIAAKQLTANDRAALRKGG